MMNAIYSYTVQLGTEVVEAVWLIELGTDDVGLRLELPSSRSTACSNRNELVVLMTFPQVGCNYNNETKHKTLA